MWRETRAFAWHLALTRIYFAEVEVDFDDPLPIPPLLTAGITANLTRFDHRLVTHLLVSVNPTLDRSEAISWLVMSESCEKTHFGERARLVKFSGGIAQRVVSGGFEFSHGWGT